VAVVIVRESRQRVTLDDAIFIRFKTCELNDPDNGF